MLFAIFQVFASNGIRFEIYQDGERHWRANLPGYSSRAYGLSAAMRQALRGWRRMFPVAEADAPAASLRGIPAYACTTIPLTVDELCAMLGPGDEHIWVRDFLCPEADS